MKIIDKKFNKETGLTEYTVKTRVGTLVLETKGASKKRVLEIAKDEDEKRIKLMPLTKAFDLKPWIVKLPPRLLQLYMFVRKYKVKNKLRSVDFFIKKKRVARLKMIDFGTPGKFKKYD